MKTKLSLIALAVSFSALGSSAQAATSGQTYHWIPAGEGIPDETMAPSTASTTTRAAVIEQLRDARRNGTLRAAGDAADENAERTELAAASTQSRAEVKAVTLAAIRDRTIVPAGETAGAE